MVLLVRWWMFRYRGLMFWYGSLMFWYGRLVLWFGRLVLWYGRLVLWYGRLELWLFGERRVLSFVLHFVGSDDAAVMFAARRWNDGVQDVCRRSVQTRAWSGLEGSEEVVEEGLR